MDKLVAFFKNVWFKRGVSLICWAYTGLMIWIAWLNLAYTFHYDNANSLFVLYLFVNIAALGLMIYTRRQVITMINCMVLPVIVFLIVIFAYGNWYMIAPPLVVVVAMFFINAANETLKTVLGTMFLLMYVIGVAAYLAIGMLMGPISFTGVDLSQRDMKYEAREDTISPSGEYRIVRYVDDPVGERRIASYYVEYTGDDVEIPFGYCKKVLGCQHVLSMQYTGQSDDPVKWYIADIYDSDEENEMLRVEGSLRENPYLIEPVESDEADDLEEVPAFAETNESKESSETAESTSEALIVGETAESAEAA